MHDGLTGATITGNTVVSMDFVDGRRGDDDLAADGVIIEHGGSGVAVASTATFPKLSEWGMILFAWRCTETDRI